MRRRTATTLLIALLLLLLLLLHTALRVPRETVTIANWNLQVFGDKKASDAVLMGFYAEKIQEYDVVFVQEIRDIDGSSFRELCALLANHTCVASSRAGRSASREQYGLAYRSGMQLLELKDYNPAHAETFERPPVRAKLSLGAYNLTLYNIHIRPDDAPAEIGALEQLVVRESAPGEAVIVLGDLNADCGYYDEDSDVAFTSWFWAITDRMDTTVSPRSCAYDRIILNGEARERYVRAGVDGEGVMPAATDHYLVWAAFTS